MPVTAKVSQRAPTVTNRAFSVLPGEDKHSFESHSKAIRAEMKKSRGGNAAVVHELVKWTFPFRREDILSTSLDVVSVLEKYPFFKSSEHAS